MVKSRNSKSRNGKRRRSPINPASIVFGEPDDFDCSCPICAELAASGTPITMLGADGKLVEVMAEPKPMMDVAFRGSASTWPHLELENQTISVPRGCTVHELLEYLCYKDQGLRGAFPTGLLHATIRGEACEPNRLLAVNDEVHVFGDRDTKRSRVMGSMLSAWPGE